MAQLSFASRPSVNRPSHAPDRSDIRLDRGEVCDSAQQSPDIASWTTGRTTAQYAIPLPAWSLLVIRSGGYSFAVRTLG
jgi:hypothetical protein